MLTQVTVVVATVLCSLVAGFLFAFAVVVMPGIKNLSDREFIRVFQEVDGVIQKGQPLFGIVWIGSVVALLLAVALGLGKFAGQQQLLLIVAGCAYFFGVQLPTIAVNIPLNNEIQALDVDGADETAWRSARERFEQRWNRWNTFRTVLAVLSAGTLSVVLLGI
ncbi:MAG: DUF1772 domain-containing protein [Gemmatimonadota bacterium]